MNTGYTNNYVYRLGFEQNLLTNGTAFTSENVSVMRKFFDIQISIDGIGGVYNKIVGRNAWPLFEKSLSRLLEKKSKGITAAVVLQRDNFSNVDSIINFCGDYGIKNIRISMQVSLGRSNKMAWNDYTEIINQFSCQLSELKILANEKGVSLGTFLEKIDHDGPVDDVGRIISPGGYSFIYVDAGGNIFPFPFLSDRIFLIGSVNKDNLKNVWLKSGILNELRNCTYKKTGCGDCRKECAFFERSLVFSFSKDIRGKALPHEECPISQEGM